MPTVTFDKGYRPETSYIFLLRGTRICPALFYIYPIVPHAPAFLHSFNILKLLLGSLGSLKQGEGHKAQGEGHKA